MSVYSITNASEQALRLLLKLGAGQESLLLQRDESTLFVQVTLEPCGKKRVATLRVADRTETMVLQADDPANANHIADYLESLANGTAETALEPAVVKQSFTTGPDQFGEAADMVNHPPHYNGHPSGVECIQVTERLPFNLGNAFKYVFRHKAKNGREDLEKASWYLNRELERTRASRIGIPIGDLQAANSLARAIAEHESFPTGAALVAIANDEPAEALHWVEHLLAA